MQIDFTMENGIFEHQTDSEVDQQKKNKCQICDSVISSKGYLKTHIESVHKGKRPYQCHICDMKVSTVGSLTVVAEVNLNGVAEKTGVFPTACG